MIASLEDIARDLLRGSAGLSLIGTRCSPSEDATHFVFSAKGLGVHEVKVSGLEELQNGTVESRRNLIASRIADVCLASASRIIEQESALNG